jgi:hypothetical protein
VTPFRAPRPLRPGQTPPAADWNALTQAADALSDAPTAYGSDLGVTDGGPPQDFGTRGHWAKLGTPAGGLYPHTERTPDGGDLPAGTGYYGDATAAGCPAREVNGRAAPAGEVVWLEIDPYRNGWVFAWAAGGSKGSIYARITGNSGKRYSFVQIAVDGSDAVVDVPSGVTGSTSAGYALDIGGGSAALHTPTPALVVLMTPNPLVAGTWLFGPVTVCS